MSEASSHLRLQAQITWLMRPVELIGMMMESAIRSLVDQTSCQTVIKSDIRPGFSLKRTLKRANTPSITIRSHQRKLDVHLLDYLAQPDSGNQRLSTWQIDRAVS
jgi:hypothetical protein